MRRCVFAAVLRHLIGRRLSVAETRTRRRNDGCSHDGSRPDAEASGRTAAAGSKSLPCGEGDWSNGLDDGSGPIKDDLARRDCFRFGSRKRRSEASVWAAGPALAVGTSKRGHRLGRRRIERCRSQPRFRNCFALRRPLLPRRKFQARTRFGLDLIGLIKRGKARSRLGRRALCGNSSIPPLLIFSFGVGRSGW